MNKDKKAIILIIVLSFILLALIIFAIRFIGFEIYWRNNDTNYGVTVYEKNKNPVFRISKLVTYSGAEAKDSSDKLQDFNISQYSDLAIYIDNHYDNNDELTAENTIKELYIDNFNIDLPKKIGENQSLYYKNPLNMGKFRELDYDRISDSLKYKIILTNDENDESYYNTPVFYTDCTNPISLSYINDNIFKNYSVKKNSSISYDGRVLKDIDINLDDITPKISFTIHIKNNLDEEYICNFACKVNFENSAGSIYSGYFVEIVDDFMDKYKFFKL